MALPKWMKPGGGMPDAVRTTLITIGAVMTVGILIQYGAVDLENDQTLTVAFGQQTSDRDGVNINVTARITNTSDEDVLLTAPSPCKVFRWVLLGPGASFIQAKQEEHCADISVEQYLKGTHYLEDTFVVKIDTTRLRDGEKLELLTRYWDKETRTPLPALIKP